MTEETPEERRARKAAEKQANHARFQGEVGELVKVDPSGMGLPELQQEHHRVRAKIVEMQELVIKGRFDLKLAQDHERTLVKHLHRIEERAHHLQSGGGGLPGEGDRTV